MTERKYLSDLTKQIKNELPTVYWVKIGDTFGGHKRLDVFAFWQKRGFVIEFKMAGENPSVDQLNELERASRGAHVFIAEFFIPEGQRHCRNVRFFLLGARMPCFILEWHKGRYINLDHMFWHLIFK